MSRTPAPLNSQFGGIDLAQAPNLIPAHKAMDALNIELGQRGAIRTRPGYAAFSGALTNQPDSLGAFIKSDGTKRLLVGNGNRIDVLDTSGASVANTTSPTASPHYFVRFGGPTIEAIYAANGTDQVRRYDTAGGFTAPAGLAGQTGKFLVVSPKSNRLVVARETGTTAGNNPSSVNFSDAGDPETFTSTNYVDLDPGDGEGISGLCASNDLVFVFKPSKFYVHYGESTDDTGSPVFAYRRVDTGGVGLAASRALAATPFGVFFLDRTGVFLTDGGAATKVSGDLDSFFNGKVQIYFQGQPLNQGSISASAMCWHENLLYVAVPTGSSTTNNRMLVYDPATQQWMIYDLPAAAMVSFAIASQPELVFARSASSKTVARHKTGADRYTADDMTTSGTDGSAIDARWRSGWTNLGSTNEKNINDCDLYGAGSATVEVFVDYQRSNPTTALAQDITFTSEESLWGSMVWGEDEWGPTTTIARKTWLRGIAATAVSLSISHAVLGESFQLNEATFFVVDERPPGFKRR